MGALLEVWKNLCPGHLYYRLLNLNPGFQDVIDAIAGVRSDLEDIRALLDEGWREQGVGALACLFHPDRETCRALLWEAFDKGSWLTPQLGILAMLLDPGGFEEVRRRLLLRCPTRHEHLDGTDPAWRHVVHGTSALSDYNLKGMAALVDTYARSTEGREWLTHHFPLSEAAWALEADQWDRGHQIARPWATRLADYLAARSYPLPDWIRQEGPEDLLGMWSLEGQPPAVRLILERSSWPWRLYRLFQPYVSQGLTSFRLEGDLRHSHLSARRLEGDQVLLDLPGPYLIPCLWNRLVEDPRPGPKLIDLSQYGEQPAALRVEPGPSRLDIYALEEYLPEPPRPFKIVDLRLEDCQADLLVVGVDAAARMDGGAAAALLAAAGPELQEYLREGLQKGRGAPGQVVVTDAFKLRGVSEIAHVVTLPDPGEAGLCRALERILHYAGPRHRSLAMPALGCGAAGYSARELAPSLVAVLARARGDLTITLALPREHDREAFKAAAKSQGLIPDGRWPT